MLQKWEYFTGFQCRWLKISTDLSSCLSLHVLIFKRVDWIWYWKWKKFCFHLSRAILRNWAFFAASLRDLVLGKKTPPEFMVHLKCKICSSKAPVKICWHIFSVAPTKQTEWNTSKLQKKEESHIRPEKNTFICNFSPSGKILLISSLMLYDSTPHEMTCSGRYSKYSSCGNWFIICCADTQLPLLEFHFCLYLATSSHLHVSVCCLKCKLEQKVSP